MHHKLCIKVSTRLVNLQSYLKISLDSSQLLKYGVTSSEALIADLLDWEWMYVIQ